MGSELSNVPHHVFKVSQQGTQGRTEVVRRVRAELSVSQCPRCRSALSPCCWGLVSASPDSGHFPLGSCLLGEGIPSQDSTGELSLLVKKVHSGEGCPEGGRRPLLIVWGFHLCGWRPLPLSLCGDLLERSKATQWYSSGKQDPRPHKKQ